MILIKTFRIRWRIGLLVLCGGLVLFAVGSFVINTVQMQATESMSWAVANKVVVIDPGHGGYDGGGVSADGVEEKEITLEISKKLAQRFSQAGGAVILTRETDADLSTPGKSLSQRKVEDLTNRVKLIKDTQAAVVVSVHTNCFGTIWTGAQTFYDPKSKEGKRLAQNIQAEIRRLIANTNRKALPLDNFLLRNLDIPAVVVEVGFLSNPKEAKLLQDPHYQEKMVYAIYAGVVKYFAGEEHRASLPD